MRKLFRLCLVAAMDNEAKRMPEMLLNFLNPGALKSYNAAPYPHMESQTNQTDSFIDFQLINKMGIQLQRGGGLNPKPLAKRSSNTILNDQLS